jgi:hypothetical protein
MEGHVLVSPVLDYALAVANRQVVLIQLRFATDDEAAPDAVQPALTLE